MLKAEQKTIHVIHGSEASEIDAVQRIGRVKPPRAVKAKEAKAGACFYHDKFGPKAFKCEGGGCVWESTPLAPKPAGNGTAGR